MTKMLSVLLVLAVLAVLVAIGKRFLEKPQSAGKADPPLPYRRSDYLLSKAERSFYEVLRQAVGGDWTVFAKVRLLDLLWLPRGTANYQSHKNRVQSKHVDFVLCKPDTLTPVLVLELDDASHSRSDRQDRDRFVDRALQAAGLPVLHVKARSGYAVHDLIAQIKATIG